MYEHDQGNHFVKAHWDVVHGSNIICLKLLFLLDAVGVQMLHMRGGLLLYKHGVPESGAAESNAP